MSKMNIQRSTCSLFFILQSIGFGLTEISNTILLILIFKIKSKRYGSYKYLMASYAVYAIIYGVIEYLAQPILITHKASFFMYCNTFVKNYYWLGTRLMEGYCSSFGLCISLLTTHFFYRYIAICKSHLLSTFEHLNLIKLFIIPLIVSTLWFFGMYFFTSPIQVKTDFWKDPLFQSYGENSSIIPYVSVLYHYTNDKGETIHRFTDYLFCISVVIVIGAHVFVILFCGFKTFEKMGNVSAMSRKTAELNRQLFRTLIIQSLIPFTTMFAPVGLFITLPMFSVNLGALANLPSTSASLYPGIDAIVAMLMIKDFRNTLLCRKTSPNQTTTVHEGSTI